MKIYMAAIIFSLGATSVCHAQAAPDSASMTLLCGGTGNAEKGEYVNSFATDNEGHSASGGATVTHSVSFGGRVQIHIEGDQGTIRVPQQLMPPIRGGRDQDGAFKLTKVEITERSIKGQFSFNFINKPKFVIDRTTGTIEMSGFGEGFSGSCERIADAPEARKF